MALRCSMNSADVVVKEAESTHGEIATTVDLDWAIAEIKQYVDQTAVRIRVVTLGGLAVATAILVIVIAVT